MSKPEPDSREARLAEQLRRNLRRRKAGPGETDAPRHDDAKKDEG